MLTLYYKNFFRRKAIFSLKRPFLGSKLLLNRVQGIKEEVKRSKEKCAWALYKLIEFIGLNKLIGLNSLEAGRLFLWDTPMK